MILTFLSSLSAQQPRTTTVAFFAERPLSDAQWSHLFAAIQQEKQLHAAEWESGKPAATNPETQLDLIQGAKVQPGIVVDQSISVYLHGDCATIAPMLTSRRSASPHPDALGWVDFNHGRISPFIHIDCALLAQVLSLPSHFVNVSHDDLLVLAIARIFLHEWLHIATQNPHHAHVGIAKSEFTAEDLIGHRHPLLPSPRSGPIFIGPAHGK